MFVIRGILGVHDAAKIATAVLRKKDEAVDMLIDCEQIQTIEMSPKVFSMQYMRAMHMPDGFLDMDVSR